MFTSKIGCFCLLANCIPRQFSTLIVHLYFLHVFLYVLFIEKNQKVPSPVLGLLRLTTPPFSHPVRCKLRLHYARLTAGGIVDLQSKFTSRKRHPRAQLKLAKGNSRAGGVSNWRALVPSSLVLSVRQKVQDITTIRKKENRLKVNSAA